MPDAPERMPSAIQPLPVLPEVVEPELQVPAEARLKARSPREIAWLRFKRHKVAIVAAGILVVIAILAIFAGVISRFDYHTPDLAHSLEGPGATHWFGTDNTGRDLFSRVLHGGRISLLVGVSVALLSGVVGTLVGAFAGYYGRWIDQLLMRLTDLFLAIPFLVVLILASSLLSGSVLDTVLILSAFFWMPAARIVRGSVLSLKEKEFVEAARATGASNGRILFSHILPNAFGPIIVILTLNVAAAILTESALSFLGFGVEPPTPSWGNLLQAGRGFTLIAPQMVWFPGLFILLTVLCVNFVGDGLRDALDPHQELRARER